MSRIPFLALAFFYCVLSASVLNYIDFYPEENQSEYQLIQKINNWIDSNNVTLVNIETFVAPYPKGGYVPNMWNELKAIVGNGDTMRRDYYLTYVQVKRLWYQRDILDESNYNYQSENITLYLNSSPMMKSQLPMIILFGVILLS